MPAKENDQLFIYLILIWLRWDFGLARLMPLKGMTLTMTHRLSTCFPVDVSKATLQNEAVVPGFAARYPMRILVAEDDYITRRVLVMFLKHLGYHVATVENGQECFDEAIRNSYDLIVTDIDMPQMSGIECARQLRHAGLTLPIVALSASCAVDPRQECMQAGMNAFLPKPVPPDKLRAMLKAASAGALGH
jgi:CheY-like chemotaxis protein